MNFETWWKEHYRKNIEVQAMAEKMTWEQIISLRNTAKVGFKAGIEFAAKDSGASASGRYVYVQYISYQVSTALSKADALVYLEWLDAGNVGRHYKALDGVKV